jgi:uncharacterized protein (DUF1330 family)
MAAYVVVDIEVTDPAGFQEYVNVAGPIVAKYGGRLLAAGPPVATLEGSWHPKGVTVIEFPTAERARQWHAAPEYQAPKQLRQRATKSNMVLLETR